MGARLQQDEPNACVMGTAAVLLLWLAESKEALWFPLAIRLGLLSPALISPDEWLQSEY
jgi:hypothetical protein